MNIDFDNCTLNMLIVLHHRDDTNSLQGIGVIQSGGKMLMYIQYLQFEGSLKITLLVFAGNFF